MISETSTICASLITWEGETKRILFTAHRKDGSISVNWDGVDTVTPFLPENVAMEMRFVKENFGLEDPYLKELKLGNMFPERFTLEGASSHRSRAA